MFPAKQILKEDGFFLFAAYGRDFSSLTNKTLDKKIAKLSRDSPSRRSHQRRVMNELESPTNNGRVTLPFLPLSLTFDNIRYSVDMPEVKQHVLVLSQNKV